MTNVHLISRIFVGITLLLTSVLNQSPITALLQLLVAATILLWPLRCGLALARSLKMLAWFVVPTIILHAAFTPGEMLFPDLSLPVTLEGLKTGLWFSLHLSAIYVAAVLFSRLLVRHEWYRTIAALPFLGRTLLPYMLLLEHVGSGVREVTAQAMNGWRRDGRRMTALAATLAELPAQVMSRSRDYAGDIWNGWDEEIRQLQQPELAVLSYVGTWITLMVGLTIWGLYLGNGVWLS